jgi:hypothetical protein
MLFVSILRDEGTLSDSRRLLARKSCTRKPYISNLYTKTIDIPLLGRRRSRDVAAEIHGRDPVEKSSLALIDKLSPL